MQLHPTRMWTYKVHQLFAGSQSTIPVGSLFKSWFSQELWVLEDSYILTKFSLPTVREINGSRQNNETSEFLSLHCSLDLGQVLQDRYNSPYPWLLYSPFFSLSIPQCIKPNSLSAETGELTSVRFCSHTPSIFKVASEKTSYLLDPKVNQSAVRSSYPSHIPIHFFRGLNLLVDCLSHLVWPWHSGICVAYSNVSCTQRVNEEDNRLTLRKHTWGTRYNSACLLFLICICPLKNTVLNLQFREAFSITLISSKQWWFTLAEGLVMFGFLKIAQQTSAVNVKDYQISPTCGSFYYISHWCPKCLCGSLWGSNSSISILVSSSYLLCYEVFSRKLPCSRRP